MGEWEVCGAQSRRISSNAASLFCEAWQEVHLNVVPFSKAEERGAGIVASLFSLEVPTRNHQAAFSSAVPWQSACEETHHPKANAQHEPEQEVEL